MNPRHAAALALVGWYLMVPPSPDQNPKAASAPLSQWKILTATDSADRCTWLLTDLRQDAAKELAESEKIVMPQWGQTGYKGRKEDFDTWMNAKTKQIILGYAQCVATDDPRLAK